MGFKPGIFCSVGGRRQGSKICVNFVIFKKTAKIKPPPNKRKFAQSGHSGGDWSHTEDGEQSATGLPDFSWRNIPKRGKIYHNITKWP
jgi:hypothetical protein